MGTSPRESADPRSPRGGLHVGVSGAPESTSRVGTTHAIARCRELGLDALEMAWVHRVTISRAAAAEVAVAAAANSVRLSVHGPYYINLNSRDPGIVEASRARIVAAARAAAWSGATDVALHLAFNHDDEPRKVFERVADGLASALSELGPESNGVTLRPEIMGRRSQFGSLDEVLALCHAVPGTAPCIDVAHLHARTGGFNSPAEFRELWARIASVLGMTALDAVHVHVSGIAYGPGGERRHLPLEESDLDYRAFLESMAESGVQGLLVAESPARERDALVLKAAWNDLWT